MSAALPLVAVVCRVPLVSEALDGVLDGIAEVRVFPGGRGDADGLLRALRPAAVVVDSAEEAEAVAAFVREHDVPLLCLSLRERTLKVLQDGAWAGDERDASPEEIRNTLAGMIYGRSRS